MRFSRTTRRRRARNFAGAFTLVEVLAALTFMAIVIPVAVRGVRVATLAGEMAARKAAAARVAERVLNEWVVTSQSQNMGLSGFVTQGTERYRWTIQTDPWTADAANPMSQVSVRVFFEAQGRPYNVRLSTLLPMAAL